MNIDKLITEATRLRLGPNEVLVLTLDQSIGPLPELVIVKHRMAEALGVEPKRVVFLHDVISMSVVSVVGDDSKPKVALDMDGFIFEHGEET